MPRASRLAWCAAWLPGAAPTRMRPQAMRSLGCHSTARSAASRLPQLAASPLSLLAVADIGGNPRLACSSAAIPRNLAVGSRQRRGDLVAAGATAALARCMRSKQWEAVQLAAEALTVLDEVRGPEWEGVAMAQAAWTIPALDRPQCLERSSLGTDVRQAAAAAACRLRSGAFRGQSLPADATDQAQRPSAMDAASPAVQTPPRVCAAPGCGATSGLRRCAGCATVRYCSAACSRAHWREHRAECRRLQAEQAAAAAGGSGAPSCA